MAERRPNVLLITTDQQRYDAMGLNGNRVLRTPNLDALAARGTNFTRCYVTCPVCIPARRTLLSGLHPDTHGLTAYRDGVDFDPAHTLPGVFRNAGYQTQLVGKLHLHPQRKRFGYDHMVLSDSGNWRPTSPHQRENDYTDWIRGFGLPTRPAAHGVNGNSRVARPFNLGEEYHHTSWVAEQAVEFFERWRDPAMPWFLHLSFVAPHPPLTPPQAYWDRYIGEPDLRPVLGEWTPAFDDAPPGRPVDAETGPFPAREIHDAIAGYYGLINHIDDRIRYLFERIQEYANPRAKEPTWVLFSSDHGELLGDHHLFRKSLAHEGSSHVPLFVSGMNVDLPRGTCDALAGWEDIMPTLIDLAGLPVPEGLDGRSLVPVMRGAAPGVRDAIFGGCDGSISNRYLVTGPHKYILYLKTGEEQVFDLVADPGERRDLSGDAALVEPLRRRLLDYLRAHGRLDMDPARCVPCANRPPRAIWGDTQPTG